MKPSPPNACNILELTADRRQLWCFDVSSNGAAELDEEFGGLPGDALPAKQVAKDWRALFSSRLNIAWLPAGSVFLRVAQFPKCDRAELLSMVELSLEKVSPLPVAQIVWTVETVPSRSSLPSEMQTVIVLVAMRHEVEKFLGTLQGRGFLADRLEVPQLHQVLATKVDGDGTWVYPGSGADLNSCLIAWWYGGELRSITLVKLTGPEHWQRELGEVLTKSAWAGELEGWLTGPPRYRLVSVPEDQEVWLRVLRELADGLVDVTKPCDAAALATLAAQRAARGESQANLLPPEFATRYRQQFVDSVWMRGLGALVALYMLGVAGYFVVLQQAQQQQADLQKQAGNLSGSYTNALVTKARIQVLQEQIALKYAAIESLKAVSAKLPEGMQLTDFSFQRGQKVALRGTVAAAEIGKLTDYSSALQSATLNGLPLFKSVSAPTSQSSGAAASQFSWTLACELRGPELE
ncbi:MAG: hypothetical protein EBS05_03405 [Proteobacteria bacterium]|nr:hypothetical protein [Pseudomonadota bacterium]